MTNIIEIKNLNKTFGKLTAVNGLNLSIPKGSIYGILGPNGAGKSTTIRMICGVLTPTSGEGTIDGISIYDESEKIKSKIGYMSQKFSLYQDLTVLENIRFFASLYGIKGKKRDERIKQLISMAGLNGREHQITKNLSGGWKQRLALGCALVHKPEILILDEPTAGVDPVARRVFWELIFMLSKQGITVLVTTHYMDEAESCDYVSFIFNGSVIAKGTPKELIESKKVETLEDVFIGYVEEITGEKVKSSFEEIKFLSNNENESKSGSENNEI
ncbi:ABC transporter ATP-binding protein [Helicovermis profundi]|uniref:ABC transporter ATP-binding protein n=1 Tax=Helicovermis profundi TaxID=3065157 RepID=A0AAU9E1L1_9FIRM|nr:ABC transporter ATP-binding protein [Clostridia bacterium S502]